VGGEEIKVVKKVRWLGVVLDRGVNGRKIGNE
jgi:hypothetical protein